MSFDKFIQTLNEEQKEALLTALTGGVAKETVASMQNPAKKKGRPKGKGASASPKRKPSSIVVNSDFTVSRTVSNDKNRVPVRGKPNVWQDTGESKEIDTPNYQPTKRARPKPKYIKATCSVCNKEIKIRKDLVYGEFFRCDKCVGRGR